MTTALLFLALLVPVASWAQTPAERLCATYLTEEGAWADGLGIVANAALDVRGARQQARVSVSFQRRSYVALRRASSGIFVDSAELEAESPSVQTMLGAHYAQLIRDASRPAATRRVGMRGPVQMSYDQAADFLDLLADNAAGRTAVAAQEYEDGNVRRGLKLGLPLLALGAAGTWAFQHTVNAWIAGGPTPHVDSLWAASAATAVGGLGGIWTLGKTFLRWQTQSNDRLLGRARTLPDGPVADGSPRLSEADAARLHDGAAAVAASWREGFSLPASKARWLHLAYGDRLVSRGSSAFWFDLFFNDTGEHVQVVAFVRRR